MTFQGERLGELLDFIDENYGDKGCLLLQYKTFGVWNHEKQFWGMPALTSCTIVFFKSDKETCDVYLWGTGSGFGHRDYLGSLKSLRDSVAEGISKYAIEKLGLRKTRDASED